jgi:ubiquinol-cytochrome c reductase cytochrome b subunit
VVALIALGEVGAHPPSGWWPVIGRVATMYYFLHFLVILPIIGKLEKPLPLPESISTPVLSLGGHGGGPLPGGATAKPMEKI